MVGPNATHVGAVVESQFTYKLYHADEPKLGRNSCPWLLSGQSVVAQVSWLCACVHGFGQTLELNKCDPAFSFIFWFLPSHFGILKWIFTPYALPSLFHRLNHGSHMCCIEADY